MRLHAAGEIDAALASARRAVELDPACCEAHAYLGNTLVARKRRFADGLAALERAAALCPGDPAILYTLGWCREFAAHALRRPRGPSQPPAQDAPALYAAAADALRRALALDPEPGLRGDIEDILHVIADALGDPRRGGERAPADGPAAGGGADGAR